MSDSPTNKTLDDMLKELPSYYSDYVFVMSLNVLDSLGDEYKGVPIRRFRYIEKDSVYLMPDPIWGHE